VAFGAMILHVDGCHRHTFNERTKGSVMTIWSVFSRTKKDEAQTESASGSGGETAATTGPDPVTVPAVNRRPMRFDQLIEGMGSFDHFDKHDRALKFCLPEPARVALEDLAKRQAQSMSELLRQFLFQHCYGVYAHALLIEKRAAAGKAVKGEFDMPMFSRASEGEPQADQSEPDVIDHLLNRSVI